MSVSVDACLLQHAALLRVREAKPFEPTNRVEDQVFGFEIGTVPADEGLLIGRACCLRPPVSRIARPAFIRLASHCRMGMICQCLEFGQAEGQHRGWKQCRFPASSVSVFNGQVSPR